MEPGVLAFHVLAGFGFAAGDGVVQAYFPAQMRLQGMETQSMRGRGGIGESDLAPHLFQSPLLHHLVKTQVAAAVQFGAVGGFDDDAEAPVFGRPLSRGGLPYGEAFARGP